MQLEKIVKYSMEVKSAAVNDTEKRGPEPEPRFRVKDVSPLFLSYITC